MTSKPKHQRISSITIDATLENFDAAKDFIAEILKSEKINSHRILETTLIFEELFLRLSDPDRYITDDGKITISLRKRLGETRILLSFWGDMLDLDFDMARASDDPSIAILSRYQDKIGRRFRRRNNSVSILVERNYKNAVYFNYAAFGLAFLTYIILNLTTTPEKMSFISNNYLTVIESLFGNAMTMIAAPVTFFSLVTNITDISVIGDQRLHLKNVIALTGRMSCTAIIVSFIYFAIVRPVVVFVGSDISILSNESFELDSFLVNVSNIIPSSLVEAFTSISPLPLIFLSVLTAIAMISMNKYFFQMKTMNDSFNALFSRMLSIIMIVLPVVVYFSFLSSLINYGLKIITFVLVLLGLILVGVSLLFLGKLIVIKLNGGKIIWFIKTCLPAISRNFNINSSIDAIQYNIRFCNRFLGVRNDILTVNIPVLAQISLAGNCFILTFFACVSITLSGITINWFYIILLGLLVFAMSISAPNQPGSFFLGMVMILKFLGIPLLSLPFIFFMEALVGRYLSLINSFGDIVTVYCAELKERRNNNAKTDADQSI